MASRVNGVLVAAAPNAIKAIKAMTSQAGGRVGAIPDKVAHLDVPVDLTRGQAINGDLKGLEVPVDATEYAVAQRRKPRLQKGLRRKGSVAGPRILCGALG